MMMIFEGTKSTITAGWELMKSKPTTLCVKQFFFVLDLTVTFHIKYFWKTITGAVKIKITRVNIIS
jgi:hypothetical protein